MPPQENEAFLREVDEELRRDQIAGIWRRWGRWIVGLVIVGLGAFGGWLWWQHAQAEASAKEGATLTTALDNLSGPAPQTADAPIAELTKSDIPGYRSAAIFSQANVALAKNDLKTAAQKFALVAGDSKMPQPVRDLALIRQTYAEFDTMKPDAVIARLKPMAAKGSPWFGSAGELTATAYLRMDKPAPAAALFSAIAADETVPQSIRDRAIQMAGVLGSNAAPPASIPNAANATAPNQKADVQ